MDTHAPLPYHPPPPYRSAGHIGYASKNKFDTTLVNHGYVSLKLLQMWPGLGGLILLKYRQFQT